VEVDGPLLFFQSFLAGEDVGGVCDYLGWIIFSHHHHRLGAFKNVSSRATFLTNDGPVNSFGLDDVIFASSLGLS
jgi:hypothetical protein